MRPQHLKTENYGPLKLQRAELHEIACRYGEEQFKQNGCCRMTWIFAVDTQVVWIEVRWEDFQEKLATEYVMRRVLQEFGAHAYAFISEVYIAATDRMPENDRAAMLAHANKHGIGSLPENVRDDALLINSWDDAGDGALTKYLVTVRRHGPNFLGPRVDEAEYHMSEGRFVNLLQNGEPDADLR